MTDQVKQLSARVTEPEGGVGKGKETVADLNDKLKASEKSAEYIAYK